MRNVTIDFSADETRRIVSFGGYDGEHNETKLCAILPPRLLTEDVTQYRFVFTNSNGEEITKEPLEAVDGAVSYLLPQQVMVYPELKFYVAALTYDGMENLIMLGKTATATLSIEYPSDGVATEENPYPDNVPIGYTVRNSEHGIRPSEDASDTAVPTEKAVAKEIEEERQRHYSKKESNNLFANALKGNAGGNPVVLPDVSPLEHELKVQTSVGGATVKRYGKNLLPYPYIEKGVVERNGITYTVNNDRSITIKGTATTGSYFVLQRDFEYSDGILDGNKTSSATNGIYVISELLYYNPNNKTLSINVSAGTTIDKTVYPQTECGTVSSEYKPYKEPVTHTADENGVVKGITSLYPTTTLIADNGAIISADYNKDINKASFGESGENGATFIPYVSSVGVISWTNDKGLDNPSPVNIKGEKGDKGDIGATGATGAQGEQGLKGDKGEKGEKGDTYTLTEADKAEIAQIALDLLGGNPVYGYVDDDNNIVVQGDLADGTYFVKYEMEDGSFVEIGTLEVGEKPETVVNLIPTLTDTDLVTVYNGIGYKENTRISISAMSESNPTGEKTQSDTTLTGMIPVGEEGDVFHFRGIDTLGTSGAGSTYDGTFWCYNESGALITTQQTYIADAAPAAMGVDENGDFTITMNSSWLVSGTAYVRFNVGKVTGDFIMTRNQLIPV